MICPFLPQERSSCKSGLVREDVGFVPTQNIASVQNKRPSPGGRSPRYRMVSLKYSIHRSFAIRLFRCRAVQRAFPNSVGPLSDPMMKPGRFAPIIASLRFFLFPQVLLECHEEMSQSWAGTMWMGKPPKVRSSRSWWVTTQMSEQPRAFAAATAPRSSRTLVLEDSRV